ncbi:MAG TPA: RICIN domain-containing protein [Polyangia bacterium]|nr:RICIN domain-containing protein [Polyangia bacterium]
MNPFVNPFGANVKCQDVAFSGLNHTNPSQPTTNGVPNGYSAACVNNYCWQNGETITVWRNPSYTPTFDDVYRYNFAPVSAPGSRIDVVNGMTDNGTWIQQYRANGLPNQKWVVTKIAGTSNWQLAMHLNPAKCMGPVGGGTAPYTQMEVQDCAGSTNQAFTITADANSGNFQLKNVASGLCLELPSNNPSDGLRMDMNTCWGGSNQQFKLSSSY